MKNGEGRRTYRSLCGGGVAAASVQREIQSPSNVREKRKTGGVNCEELERRRG
jgi:hypothetical protein